MYTRAKEECEFGRGGWGSWICGWLRASWVEIHRGQSQKQRLEVTMLVWVRDDSGVHKRNGNGVVTSGIANAEFMCMSKG